MFMSRAQIRFSPEILRRLGEELNPTVDQGIIELVKNAYDADARECRVELVGADAAGGAIRIIDDGVGMTGEDIMNSWLILGRSTKDPHQRTSAGRVPVGSKGLGRLAALRMGAAATVLTAPVEEPNHEYSLDIEWQRYDAALTVEEVPLDVNQRPRTRATTGTTIELQDLRRPISRNEVRNLARAMVLLADPFAGEDSAFDLRLTAPEFADYERLVANRYFDEADFHLVAEVGPDGKAKASVVDWRGEALYSAEHEDIARAPDRDGYDCPPTAFDLWAFILSGQNFATRPVSVGEVQAWLKAFGGVHFYLNGIRVAPYGNAGNDWLDMNLRRVRSPEERPGTNTSIGRVAVSDFEGVLSQKTDRSGFIEDEAFLEVRRFAQDALEWMARRRLDTAEKRRAQDRASSTSAATSARATLVEVIEKAPSSSREELRQAYTRYDRAREREADALRREIQLYRTLSTAGITAATFAHESSGNPLKVIAQAIGAIERRAQKLLGGDLDGLAEPIRAVRRAVDSLGVLGAATLRLVAPNKRRIGRVDLNGTIREVLATFEPFTASRSVVVEASYAPGQPYLRGTEAAVESIVANLLNNSMVALEGKRQRRIRVATRVVEDTFELIVEDTGGGLDGVAPKDVWLPGFTTRTGGTGLGLTIVKDAAADLGGTAAVETHGDLGGAVFTISLPILGT
jgi:signal transduction histidine kinase